ncbi:MAG: MGH1-like glycoside hydrolase domain-containing protein [Candidatus Woesearchaeota archaeon]
MIGSRLEPAELDAAQSLCQHTLSQDWREGVCASDQVKFAYTRPSPRHYPWQWYWDSCFAAIAWRRFDPYRPEAELRSLLAAQQPDGFIGHTIFWTGQPRDIRRFTYNVLSRSARMTASIQPPALAWSWRISVGDPSLEPGIAAHHNWLAEHRDLDGDGLIWIVQPDESGLDASPQFDPIWGRRSHGLPGFLGLVHRNRRLGYDLAKVEAAGGPVCCEVMTNVLYGLSRLALGEPSLTATIVERMYDEATGVFWPLARPAPQAPIPLTWTALSPLALPDLPEEIGRRLVEEYLLDPARFWLPVPVPSVAADERSFSLRDTRFGIHRYWRGPSWVNAAWLLWLGLRRLGYDEHAGELARRVVGAMLASGLREYYDPYTGRGMGARSFAWSALAVELADPDPAAASSYLTL